MNNKSLQGMDRSIRTMFPEYWLQALDAWRNQQTVPPSRAAAILYLVELGLKYEAACKRLSKEGEK